MWSEVAFSTYAPGQYHGDSVVNSVFDMIPSMSGVVLGRHIPGIWPAILLAEIMATRMGFGIHSVFLGHQGSICDVRTDPAGCGLMYVFKIFLLPMIVRWVEGALWSYLESTALAGGDNKEHGHSEGVDDSPLPTRRAALASDGSAVTRTPEAAKLVMRRPPPGVGGPPEFKL